MKSESQTVEIDLNAIESVQQLHILFAQKLQFPDWYGRNWDAFWDSITDLVELPPRICLIGWQSFESRFPRDARILRECFTDYQKEMGGKASSIEYA